MKCKIDIVDLAERIIEALNSSRSRYVKDYGIMIEVCLKMLLSYLQSITVRAIEIDDAVIMSDLLNIGALIPDNKEEEKEIHERARAIKGEIK